ncbi:glycosyltransferase family 39 protein [Edaphobacter sp. 12200R-103]|jgi:hypothetical protein|uniref:glycosyltransferase family 39 protein n=1 Tax=Edaphobacter sp. 12200R-103 TaxID=2703788 RepID=UPI00138BA390|nr:glycosyltransferase family 39 protein [Edaphobacter sp. 12200R-103]QHS50547.1 hypothetical protein GWR55_01375 [Edaphobacter sp. 12200R-103]
MDDQSGIAVDESSKREEGKKVPWQIFALVIGCSLLIRLFVLRMIAATPLVSDSQDYRAMALQLAGGVHFVPYWPPGLPVYLIPFLAMGLGDVALRASMLLWWTLFCWALVRLGRDLGLKDRAILLILAIFSITPAHVHFSVEPMTQIPSAALLLLAVSATVRCWKDPDWREAALLGGAAGWLALVRPSALPLLIALPALAYFGRRRLREPVIAVALGGMMILAWVGKVHQLSGQWKINNSNGVNLYYGNNPWTPLYRTWYFGSHAKPESEEIHRFPEYEKVVKEVFDLPETERGEAFQKRAVDYVLQRPDLFLLRSVNRVRCFWGFDIFTAAHLRQARPSVRRWFPVVLVLDAACYLVVAGFAFFWIAAAPGAFCRRWETWLLAGAVLFYAFPYWMSMSHPTYHFPVIAPLALLGALAYQVVCSSGERNSARGRTALAVLLLIQAEWVFFFTRT